MTTVRTKRTSVDYRCQDCGLVVTVKKEAKTTPHGELMCCNEPMKAD